MNSSDRIKKMLEAGMSATDIIGQGWQQSAVYRIQNEMLENGELEAPSLDGDDPEEEATVSAVSAAQRVRRPTRKVGLATNIDKADVVDFGGSTPSVRLPGAAAFSSDAISRVRGILGIAAVPKVLRMPMPEMLYPAMVIATTELHFPPMQPQDFIDTVLYQWLEACGYIPNVYIKKSELEDMVTKYNTIDDSPALKKYIKEHGLMTADQFKAMSPSHPSNAAHDDGNGNGNGNGNGGHPVDDAPQIVPDEPVSATPPADVTHTVVAAATGNAPAVNSPAPQVTVEPIEIPTGTPTVHDGIEYTISDATQLNLLKEFGALGDRPTRHLVFATLAKNGIETVGDLRKLTKNQLRELRGIGQVWVEELAGMMTSIGFDLKDEPIPKPVEKPIPISIPTPTDKIDRATFLTKVYTSRTPEYTQPSVSTVPAHQLPEIKVPDLPQRVIGEILAKYEHKKEGTDVSTGSPQPVNPQDKPVQV